MAQYIRFEIYIPVLYTSKQDGKVKKHALDQSLLDEFIEDITAGYGGFTQANPLAPTLYEGWWIKDPTQSPAIIIDHLTYLFGLVAIDDGKRALQLFTEWKEHFEKTMSQDVVLVVYYPVQTIGDFL